MEKLAKFVGEEGNQGEEEKMMLENAQKIYPLLMKFFDTLQEESMEKGPDMEILKLFDLCIAFIKFVVKCCPENDKLNSINHVITSCFELLKKFGRRLSREGVKKLGTFLAVPLQSSMSLFDFQDFDGLMNFLDYPSRKSLGLKIIDSLLAPAAEESVDSLAKVQKLLKFENTLLEDSVDATEVDDFTFATEQNAMSKVIFVINSHDPEELYAIFGELKNTLSAGGVKRRKFTMPCLANCVIKFCHTISMGYDYKNGLIPDEKKTPIEDKVINSIDVSKIENDDIFYKLMLNVYQLLNEIISTIGQENPEMAFRLYLTAASQVNSIRSAKQTFEEACASFLNAAMAIYQEGKYDQDIKYGLLSEVSGHMLTFNVLGQENIEGIIKTLTTSSQTMVKRGDQCYSMLAIADLYFTLLKDANKVLDSLNKAKRYADFAMTNPTNLHLFVTVLNKYLYYVENGGEVVEIKPEIVDDIIFVINNHIQTIRSDTKVDASFLPPVIDYYNNTLKTIKTRKTAPGHKPFYDEILN